VDAGWTDGRRLKKKFESCCGQKAQAETWKASEKTLPTVDFAESGSLPYTLHVIEASRERY
jgi:hypothetical protein